MNKKKEKEFVQHEMQEAVDVIDAYINNQYKSIYLVDAWMKLKEFVETNIN